MSAMKRATKVGDMAAIERKLEERYDKEQELGTQAAIMDWINAALDGEQGFEKCPGLEWKQVADYFKDGAVLCRLMNKLLEADGQKKISFKANPKQAFAAMNNIEQFNKACQEYGVPTTATFQTTDLVDGRKGPLVNVVNCLNQLGFTANAKNFKIPYVSPEPPKGDM